MHADQYPKAVLRIVEELTAQNLNDIDGAVKAAELRVRQLPEFQSLIDKMVGEAVKQLVYAARHQVNSKIRNGAAQGQEAPKGNQPVSVGSSSTVQGVYRSYYNYCIGARTLGVLTGGELEDIAVQQEQTAKGYLFNATLLRRLAGMVQADKTVRQCVTPKRLEALFAELQREQEETG